MEYTIKVIIFEPFDDATNYYGEHDCTDAFDDEELSARYFDHE